MQFTIFSLHSLKIRKTLAGKVNELAKMIVRLGQKPTLGFTDPSRE